MRVIYKQDTDDVVFADMSVKNCYIKQSRYNKDVRTITKKEHHHTSFEIHIINSGHQIYQIMDKEYIVGSGQYLVIPPEIKHRCKETSPDLEKIAITFHIDEGSPFKSINKHVCGKTTERMEGNLNKILEENKNKLFNSLRIVENCVFEILVLILRSFGVRETALCEEDSSEDMRFFIAKQYINDNIELDLKVSDVAAYCYLGTKQLTRLFKEVGDITPAAYIQKKRIDYIEKLLLETELSLHDISEKMNFSSEYHFNSFFKKIAGMPPGAFRKMIK